MDPTKEPVGQRSSRADDVQWFEDLFGRYHGAIHAYVCRRTYADADDLVAEVFTIAWRKRDQVPAHALPWLYGVAAREVLHTIRDHSRRGTMLARLASRSELVAPDLTDQVDDRVAAHGPVTTALGRMSPADAEVLQLWAWEQLEPAEIATVLNVSAVAARVRLHRARRRLEAALAAQARPSPASMAHPAPVAAATRSPLTTRELSHD